MRDAKRLGAIVKILGEAGSEDYLAAASKLRTARDAFHEEIASRLCDSLNNHIAKMPQSTLEDKKSLAKWLNAEMRSLGIAIRCLKSGGPAYLQAAVGDDRLRGRFQVCLLEHPNHARTQSMQELTSLEFMAGPDRGRHGNERSSRMR
jgi:hypothetical protein